MLIGGLAVSIWGEPRSTIDVDLSLWVEESDIHHVVTQIGKRLRPIPPDPISFVAELRTLPVTTSNGVRADLVFATLPGERRAIARAAPKQINGNQVMVATVEDLIWMKLISERQKDLDDARRLIRRFAATLDRGYLEPLLQQLSEAFARSEILAIYRTTLHNHA